MYAVSNHDYSDMIDALWSAIQSAKSAKPVEANNELARVMRHRDRVIRHSPKRGYQALSDRAARVMAAANDFISKELQ